MAAAFRALITPIPDDPTKAVPNAAVLGVRTTINYRAAAPLLNLRKPGVNVRFWHLADIPHARPHVCF